MSEILGKLDSALGPLGDGVVEAARVITGKVLGVAVIVTDPDTGAVTATSNMNDQLFRGLIDWMASQNAQGFYSVGDAGGQAH